MIDNFKLIEKLVYFDETSNLFFHCQIIQRTKDNEITKGKNKHIGTYFIKSVEHLNRIREEIILLCEHYKARAYINVATKNFEAMQKTYAYEISKKCRRKYNSKPNEAY